MTGNKETDNGDWKYKHYIIRRRKFLLKLSSVITWEGDHVSFGLAALGEES